MNALYNEIEPYAADWLDNLIAAGHIARGRVERRSIADLAPADVAGPGQRHFFAGIGGWSYALRLAGVPDDADVWTGSCPCQPFSDAGKRSGTRDPRHLWPAWFELIRECRPPAIFGEQVASRAGLAWFDAVRADLERCGYAVGASDLCAASVGAPHIRQRLFFVAFAGDERREGERLHVRERGSRSRMPEVGGGAARLAVQLGNSSSSRSGRDSRGLSDAETSGPGTRSGTRRVADEPVDAGADGAMANDNGDGLEATTSARGDGAGWSKSRRGGCVDWRNVEWLPCLDGKARPVEPGLEPLAHGVSGRVVVRGPEGQAHEYNRAGALAGFGNAIVPELGAAFIQAAIAARRSVK